MENNYDAVNVMEETEVTGGNGIVKVVLGAVGALGAAVAGVLFYKKRHPKTDDQPEFVEVVEETVNTEE